MQKGQLAPRDRYLQWRAELERNDKPLENPFIGESDFIPTNTIRKVGAKGVGALAMKSAPLLPLVVGMTLGQAKKKIRALGIPKETAYDLVGLVPKHVWREVANIMPSERMGTRLDKWMRKLAELMVDRNQISLPTLNKVNRVREAINKPNHLGVSMGDVKKGAFQPLMELLHPEATPGSIGKFTIGVNTKVAPDVKVETATHEILHPAIDHIIEEGGQYGKDMLRNVSKLAVNENYKAYNKVGQTGRLSAIAPSTEYAANEPREALPTLLGLKKGAEYAKKTFDPETLKYLSDSYLAWQEMSSGGKKALQWVEDTLRKAATQSRVKK